ncbi:MAG: circadian clock protein KaiC, partial [Oligoflexales bacterium]|nr:circadian clock protein KaiC [Oligoflexales bacterium]
MTGVTIGETSEDRTLPKALTGIQGLDEITGGGLPVGRPTLICGGPGCGKTLMAMEFLIHGAIEFNEPGIFMSFEETEDDLVKNVKSLGFDLDDLVQKKKISMDYVYIDRSEIFETGEYDLEGLFVRLEHAIETISAKRVVLDTIESLFSGLSNTTILRSEIRRLFKWLKEKGVTAIVTGERGEGLLTRQGLEEYVSDCVILLDQRVNDQLAIRRLRIIKYRGSSHGTNEYPFLIDERGISVLPITSTGLTHEASLERVSSGIPKLDEMLGGKGYYRGTTVLISGSAGSGKTNLSTHFVEAACLRGEKCLYFHFEESESQWIRNTRSIGLDMEPWIKGGMLHFHAARPTLFGLEMHLTLVHRMVCDIEPRIVVIDPISNLISVGRRDEVKSMLVRLIDFLKSRQITTVLTDLSQCGASAEMTEMGISSLMDTWLLLRDIESNGERNRCLYIMKSRGMAHSNQLREFLPTDKGITLVDVYLGSSSVLTGSARLAQQMREKVENVERLSEIERLKAEIEKERQKMELHINLLKMEFMAKEKELLRILDKRYAE